MVDWISVKGVVTQGHGVASGQGSDPRYPKGTLELQRPVFKAMGVDLDRFFPGTLNVSIAPHQYSIKTAKYTLKDVRWTSAEFTEDFSFFDCRLVVNDGTKLAGLIYYPHPETKPEHFQSPDILEIITHRIEGLKYGDELIVEVDPAQIDIQ